MDERASHGRRVRTDEDADSGSGGNAGGKDHDAGSARWLRGGSHASDATIGVALIVLQLTLLVLCRLLLFVLYILLTLLVQYRLLL